MNTSSYLIPENPFALAIVKILGLLFAVWVLSLVARWIFLAVRKRQVEKCADVSILKQALQCRLSLSDPDNPSELQAFREQANAAFTDFCAAKKIKPKRAIARHLRAIFDAGLNESRLEISPLVKNTSSYLLRTSSLFRSVLSLFIIIGLLGTLAGLGSTLGRLSEISLDDKTISAPANNQNTPQPVAPGATQTNAAKGLKTLLEQLKSAFAPSFWGVLFTILGVLLFGFFQQFSHTPLRDALERHTLVDWVPALIPTPSQSLWEKLQVSEQQIQASLETAKDVAKLAASLQDDSSELSKSIRDAKEAIPQLTRSSTQLENFSDKFVNAVSTLTPFQRQLQQLYEQLATESKTFHEAVERNIERGELFQQGVKTQLDSQNTQIVAMLEGFSAYEKAYLQTRERIDDHLGDLLRVAQNAYMSLAERNQEVITTIVSSLREPLSQDLATGLGKVENSLDVRLTALSKELELLQVPMNRAAGGLEGTLENLNKRTETLLKEVQQEFFERNRLQERQVTEIANLTGKFSNSLEQLSSSNRVLTEYEQQLGANVNELSQSVGSLGGNINAWNQSVSSHEFSNLLTQLSSNNKLLTEHEQALGANVNELARNVGSLGSHINVLNQSLNSNGRVKEAGLNSETIAELRRFIVLNEQLLVQLKTLVQAVKIRPEPPRERRYTPPPLDVQQPTPPPVDFQEQTPPPPDDSQQPTPERESFLKRTGGRLLFWRH